MKFSSPTVKSIPISSLETKHPIPVTGRGDTWFFSILPYILPEPNWNPVVPPNTEAALDITPTQISSEVHATALEGTPLTFTLSLLETSLTDVTGTYRLLTVEDGVEQIPDITNIVVDEVSEYDNTPYINTSQFSLLSDADVDTQATPKTGSYTITAGNLSTDITFNTTDDLVFTGGEFSYKTCRLNLTCDQGLTLPEQLLGTVTDAHETIVPKGSVGIMVQVHKDASPETLISADTGVQETLSLVDSSTVILDATPLHMVYTDGTGISPPEGVDTNNHPLFYQIIVQSMES